MCYSILEKCGSLVLMAENDPYTFKINMILKKLEFPNKKRVKFTISGNDKGGKILYPDNDNSLKISSGTFNKNMQEINNVERASLSYNILKIFKGYSVSFAQGSGDIDHFITFSKDSNDYINSLFYNGSYDINAEGEGHIFIDCGYTKFFLNMDQIGN